MGPPIEAEARSRSELQNQLLAHLGLARRDALTDGTANRDGLPAKGVNFTITGAVIGGEVHLNGGGKVTYDSRLCAQ